MITLLTDFGTADGYVAEMKGAIYRVHPAARLVDITHDIRPYDLHQAAFILGRTYAAFPPGTVHVAVVDPGVGTARKGIALLTAGGHVLVGPDNGIFSWVVGRERVVRRVALTNRKYFGPRQSATFHGRDRFGPVAAHLSLGTEIQRLGPEVKALVLLSDLQARRRAGRIEGRVLHHDRFGNLLTNIPSAWVTRGAWRVRVEGCPVGRASAYGHAAPGEAVAVPGSDEFLEIAVNQGSALDRFGARPRVTVERG